MAFQGIGHTALFRIGDAQVGSLTVTLEAMDLEAPAPHGFQRDCETNLEVWIRPAETPDLY